MTRSSGPWLVRHCGAVVLAGILLFVGAALYGADAMSHLTQDGGFGNPGSETDRAIAVTREHLGLDQSPVLVLFTPHPTAPFPPEVDHPAYRDAVERSLALLGDSSDVRSVFSYYSTGRESFKSHDGTQTYAVVNLAYGTDYGFQAFVRLRERLQSDAFQIQFGGELGTAFDNEKQLREDLLKGELISFPILAVALLLVFGSAVAAGLPLAVGGMTIVVSLAVLKGVTHFMEVTVFAANVVSILGLGLAVDYSLFVVNRFREELARGKTVLEAVCISSATAGRTVVFSGVTVILSLLSMLWFEEKFFRSMGLAGAVAVTVSVLTSITLLPAVLALLGERVNALAVRRSVLAPSSGQETLQADRWYRLSRRVMRHPVAFLGASMLILAILGAPFLRVKIGFSDSRALPSGSDSRTVLETVSGERFPRGDVESLFLAIKTKGAVTEAANLAAIHALVEQVRSLPSVHRVDSLVSLDPSFTLEDYQQFFAHPEDTPLASESLELFARGEYTRVVVYFDADNHSDQSRALVQTVRALEHPQALEFVVVGGYPAFMIDYLASLREGLPWLIGSIVIAIFLILFVMLGSLLVPLKAIVLNTLSLAASFGALVWIFQDGRFTELLGFTRLDALDGSIVVIVFAMAFGLSMDYEVFLLSRIKEQYDRTGDPEESVAIGVQRTGRIISNAALLISMVFVVFSTGKVVFLKELGVGLFVAVLVDATLVRLVMVPAAMRLMGHWNWWLPGPLGRLHRWIGLAEVDPQRSEH